MSSYAPVLTKLLTTLRANRMLYLLAAFIYGSSTIILQIFAPEQRIDLSLYSVLAKNFGAAILATYCIIYFLSSLINREPKPLTSFLRRLIGILKTPHQIITFCVNLFAVIVVLSSFTTIKFVIPEIVPFQHDELFHHWDVLLHFGSMPWEMTHQWFSSPYATGVINVAYNIWIFVVIYTLFHFLVINHPAGKVFVISFVLVWFGVGNILAVMGSSVGPCFSYRLIPEFRDYLPLMERLVIQSEILTQNNWWPVWALKTQDMLWQQYSSQTLSIGSGISAMPSVHVSTSVLMALAFYQISRVIGWCFFLYALIIMVGSVHLAWHYAVDGYIGAICTILIWSAVKKLLSVNDDQST